MRAEQGSTCFAILHNMAELSLQSTLASFILLASYPREFVTEHEEIFRLNARFLFYAQEYESAETLYWSQVK